jgi:glucosamine-6-phosphate deaminase
MEIVVLPDGQAIGALAADAIANLLQRKPDAVLGLATGSSPLAIYDELAARCAAGSVTLGRGQGIHSRRVRRAARRPPGDLPERDRSGLRVPGRLRAGARCGVGRIGCRHPEVFYAEYESAMAEAGGVDLQ